MTPFLSSGDEWGPSAAPACGPGPARVIPIRVPYGLAEEPARNVLSVPHHNILAARKKTSEETTAVIKISPRNFWCLWEPRRLSWKEMGRTRKNGIPLCGRIYGKLFTFHEKWRKWDGSSWRDSYLLVKKRVVRTQKLMYNNQQKFMDAAQGPEPGPGGVTVQI